MYVYKKQPNITLIELHLSKACLQIHKWQTRSNTGIFLLTLFYVDLNLI